MSRQVTQSPVKIFVQEDSHSARREHKCLGVLEQGDDLLAFYAREAFEKLLDRIARLQVIEQTLRRHSRSGKDRLAAKNIRMLSNDAAHIAN